MIRRFDVADLPVSPWRNGGGETREIAAWPPFGEPDAFDWRVSVATIAASGPFSVFPGIDRTIMLIEGDGVQLRADDLAHRLDTPCEPFAFSGDLAMHCILLGGASIDFNVMCRRGRCQAAVRVFNAASKLAPADHGLLLSVRGQWRAGGGTLKQGQGVWWGEQTERWRLKPASRDARIVAVGWSFATGASP